MGFSSSGSLAKMIILRGCISTELISMPARSTAAIARFISTVGGNLRSAIVDPPFENGLLAASIQFTSNG